PGELFFNGGTGAAIKSRPFCFQSGTELLPLSGIVEIVNDFRPPIGQKLLMSCPIDGSKRVRLQTSYCLVRISKIYST
ncbi:MAG: hypothetical protein VX416_17695, partial [Pseudomonadota bacterium]|nr:hypothetical protein [Pseudomonadota bacterium]